MKKVKGLKQNNAGYTLVELMVTLAITAIALTAIYAMAVVISRQYQVETREVKIQQEAQMTMNQLQDLLIDATEGVTYAVNGTNVLTDSEVTGAVTGKVLKICNETKYYEIEWSLTDEKLYYTEYNRAADGSLTMVADSVLMAEYVKAFSVNLKDIDRNNCVRLDVLFSNQREYQVTQNVKLRNQVQINVL